MIPLMDQGRARLSEAACRADTFVPDRQSSLPGWNPLASSPLPASTPRNRTPADAGKQL